MVLVDTSVWIRFFSDQKPFRQELDRLLSLRKVGGHDLVYGELLVGDKGGRQAFLKGYQKLYRTKVIDHSDVADFVRAAQLHGLGIGWIDAHLLATALAERLKLWTADPRLATVAKEFGVAYS
jgi:hypothetical protein